MKKVTLGNDLILYDTTDFNLSDTFECGQCFRWEQVGENEYFGIAYGRPLLIKADGNQIILHETTVEDFDNIWKNYFDFDTSYGEIKKALSSDTVLADATAFGGGIRILNQSPFEALISFIISASNNIPRIKGIIARLCENFGDEVCYMGKSYHAFPTPSQIASLSPQDLSVIRAGFREKYILSVAKAVASGEFELDALQNMSYSDAKSRLLTLCGVGDKVSDCVLLFSLGKRSSFPVDVWIKRIMEHCYFGGRTVPNAKISAYARKHFGEYGGYAQQYLFYWARENKIGV